MSIPNAPLRICMLAAEARPYATDGGLADVVGALPEALAALGLEVRVFTPFYRAVRRNAKLVKVADLPAVTMGDRDYSSALFADSGQQPRRNYFIQNDEFFDRDGVYNQPSTGEGYPDNFERFNFFSLSALDALKTLDWRPDVIHCHDSQTGLVPPFLKLSRALDPFYRGIPTLYTIHNVAYQGIFEKAKYALTGLPSDLFYAMGPFEFFGQLNCMKAGICYADALNTVSPQYAREIQTPELGYGLDDVLRNRQEDLCGILNGIDTASWDPSTDPLIYRPFSADDLSGKAFNKERLQDFCGFAIRDVPLIGMISRLADQKGFDLFLEATAQLNRMDCQWVILGTGLKKYHDALRDLAHENPEKFAVFLEYNNRLAHQIEAGVDMFLMPSRYEPCGLNQIYSMRYGAIPVVRHTGGLADTVTDFGAKDGLGTGFKFQEYSSVELLKTLYRAIAVWKDKVVWRRLVRNAMAQDFSWKRSAGHYLDVYKKVVLNA
jgi:starch synthase